MTIQSVNALHTGRGGMPAARCSADGSARNGSCPCARQPASFSAPQFESADLDIALRRIASDFPEITWKAATLDDTGRDHYVVFLDEDWVFRFPHSVGRSDINIEAAHLERIAECVTTPVPRYIKLSSDYGGYRRLPGERLDSLIGNPRHIQDLLTQAGGFLAELHRVGTNSLPESPAVTSPEVQAELYYSSGRATLGGQVRVEEIGLMDRFFERYARLPAAPVCLLHFDFKPAHLLCTNAQLTGVIDFSDVVLGDPAHDFAGFWTLGEWAVATMLSRYQVIRADAAILTRSRMHHVAALVWLIAASARLAMPVMPHHATQALRTHLMALDARH